MLSDPVAEAFGLIHRHPSGENFWHGTTKQYANRADPSSLTKVTRFSTQAYAAGNNSKLAPYRLWILNLADWDRDHLLLFIC